MCQMFERPLQEEARTLRKGALEIQAFCLRFPSSRFCCSTKLPDSLTLHCPPRSNRSVLEINGRRIRPCSGAFITLQRSRQDEKYYGGVCYVSRDVININGDLCFDIYVREEALVSGTLEKSIEMAVEDMRITAKWNVECTSRVRYPYPSIWNWKTHPVVEVSISGQVEGEGANKSHFRADDSVKMQNIVKLIPRRRRVGQRTLDAIPEGNEEDSDLFDDNNEDSDCSNSSSSSDCDCDAEEMRMIAEEAAKMKELEEEENSWLSSGLSFGVALGMCIGVGLLVGRTRPLRRRLLLIVPRVLLLTRASCN